MAPSKAGLNRLLVQILSRDADIDGFVARSFANLVRRVARGTDGAAKIDILVENVDAQLLLEKLSTAFPVQVAKNEHLLAQDKLTTGAPFPDAAPLVGRAELLESIAASVHQDKPEQSVLVGPAGIGKTSLAVTLLHAPASVERFGGRRYLARLDTASDTQATLVELSRALEIMPQAPLRSRVMEALKRAPALLVLDDLDVPASADLANVQGLLTDLASIGGVVIVATSRDSERTFDGFRNIAISPLADDAARETAKPTAEELEAIGIVAPLLAALPNGVDTVSDAAALPPSIGSVGAAALVTLGMATQAAGRVRLCRSTRDRTDLGTLRAEDLVRATYHYTSIALTYGPKIGWPETDMAAKRLSQESDNIQQMISLGFSGPHRIAAVDAAVAIATFIGWSGHCTPEVVEKARDSAKAHVDKLGEAECTQALGDILLARHQIQEARQWFIDALPLFDQAHAGLGIAACLVRLGDLALERQDYDEAQARFTAAIPAYRSILDKFGEATVVKSLGDVASTRNDLQESRKQYKEALALFESIGDKAAGAQCKKGIADAAFQLREHEEAKAIYEDIGPIFEELGDRVSQTQCLHNLGDIAFSRGKHADANQFYQKELPLLKAIGDKLGEGACMAALGDVAAASSEIEDAQAYYHAALPLLRAVDEKYGMANCIQSLGDIALSRMDQDTARDNYEQALFLFNNLGDGCAIGWTHYRLAQVAGDPEVFKTHILAANDAWQGVGRQDLIKEMGEEFPGVLP